MKLTHAEVAKALDLPLSTLDRWVRQGRIPIRRSGDGFDFDSGDLKKWAAKHQLPFQLSERVDTEPEVELLESLRITMARGGIFHGIEGEDSAAVLLDAVRKVPLVDGVARDTLYQRLLEREQLTSTGVGQGIAIPHPRTPMSDHINAAAITTCFLRRPLDFSAIDDQPVFVLFILLSTSVKVHLHLLSRLSFCARDNHFVAFLKTNPEPVLLLEQIDQLETRLGHP